VLAGLAVANGFVKLPNSNPAVEAVVKDVPGIDVDRVPAADTSSTASQIDVLIARIRSSPEDGPAYRDLGLAFIQWYRETADPILLDRAGRALEEARRRLGDDPLVVAGEGGLLLSRHDAKALEVGRKALTSNGRLVAAHGVVVDALVELGRYDEAIEAAERMTQASRGDLQFIDMMVPHHQSAVEMAKIAQQRADHPELRGLADEIIAAQEDEIGQMRAWRKSWFGSDDTPSMDAMPMLPGMAMEGHTMGDMVDMTVEIEKLKTAEPFDRAFIEAMIAHHTMAIAAGQLAQERAENADLKQLAGGIVTAQEGEITRMKAWLEDWY